MLIPPAKARRFAVGLALLATLAACGSSTPRSRVAGPGASTVTSDSPEATTAPPSDSPESSGAPGASGRPSTSATSPAGSPTKTTVGANYRDRLPKFGKAPKAVPVNLPEGSSAAWFSRIPTDQQVAFLTIDDGWVKRPEALELFKQAGVPVTLFLSLNAIQSDTGYFKRLQNAGAVIEAHTLTHQNLKGKSYSFQRHEICGSADQLGNLYGRRPVLFRPPFGEKDATTLQVVHDCGMRAAFFWKETVDKGIVRFQSGNTVQRGDIILMHFRDRFVDDFIAALQAISAAGLTPALLEDYIPH